jgi:L-fucose isomerase-like protein
MKINVIRLSNSLDPNASFKKDGDAFIDEINNELFDKDYELVENDESALFNVIFIETGGSEQHFVKIEKELPRPIILISDCLNNSLPACLEIKSFLYNNKEDCILLFGKEKEIASAIVEISKIEIAKRFISGANLGVIGKPSDWLIASLVDYEQAKKIYNVNLIDITSKELKMEIDKGMLENIPNIEKYRKLAQNNEVLTGALKIYSGLKRIIERYKLKGFTLRCFDLIEEYQNTACLALAILNDEGIIASCEGDVPSMLSMLIVKACTDKVSFQANPSRITFGDDKNQDNEVLFAHCTLPLSMANKLEFMTHFESGLGIGVRGELSKGEITIFKLSRDLKNFLLISGEIKENLTLPNYCRTQILVKIGDEELYPLINKSFGNHVIISYGDNSSEISNVLHYFSEQASLHK